MSRKAASTKDKPHRGMPDGIPKWIAADPDALIALLPAMNRQARRKFISKSSLTQGEEESDQSLLYRIYSGVSFRFRSFWIHADVVGSTFRANAPPSLEIVLLDQIKFAEGEPFSESEFTSTFSGTERIRDHLNKVRGQTKPSRGIPATGLKYLGKWKWALDVLADYPRLTEKERNAVRIIVFCTATVVDSAWPIERAIELAPEIAKEFEDILSAPETEVELVIQTDATEEPKAEATASQLQRGAEFGKEIGKEIGEIFDDLPPKTKGSVNVLSKAGRSPGQQPEDWETAFEDLRNVASQYLESYPSLEEKTRALEVMGRARELLQQYEPESPYQKKILGHLDELRGNVEADIADGQLGEFTPDAEDSLALWMGLRLDEPLFSASTEAHTAAVVSRMRLASEQVRGKAKGHSDAASAFETAQKTRPPVSTKEKAELKKNRNVTENEWVEAQQQYLDELRFSLPPPSDSPPTTLPPEGKTDPESTPAPTATTGVEPTAESTQDEPVDLAPMDEPAPTSDVPAGTVQVKGLTAGDDQIPSQAPALAAAAGTDVAPTSENSVLIEQRVREAIRAGRTDAAYQIVSLTNQIGESIPATLPSETLLHAATLAKYLHDPEGEIAQSLLVDLAKLNDEFSSEETAYSEENQVLLWSTLLRPLLFAPDTVAHELVDRLSLGPNLTPAYQFIVKLRELSKEVFRQRIDGRIAFESLRNEKEWATKTNALRQKFGEWMQRETNSMFKYSHATKLWHDLVDDGAPINEYFSRITAVRLSPDEITKETEGLAKTFNEWKYLVSSRRIIGAPGDSLRHKIDNARELAEEWIRHHRARPDPSDHLAKRLVAIRDWVESQHKTCRESLVRVSRSIEFASAAAANAVLELDRLQQLVSLKVTAPPADPSPQSLLGRPLIEFTDAPLNAEWQLDSGVDELATRNALMENGITRRDPHAVMRTRLESEDLLGGDYYLSVLREIEPQAEKELRQRHQQDAREFWDRWERNCRMARERLEYLEVYELLTDADRKGLHSKLEFAQNAQNDNQKSRAAKQALQEIESTVRYRLEEKREELHQRLSTVSSRMEPGEFEFVTKALVSDDLAATQEYLTRIEGGERINISEMDAGAEFENFHSGPIRESLNSLLQGKSGPLSPKFIDSISHAGALDWSGMDDQDKISARKLLGAWQDTRSIRVLSSSDNVNPKTKAIRDTLESIGFASVDIRQGTSDSFKEGHDLSLDCEPIRDREICPTPQFGSLANGRYRLLALFGSPTAEQVMQRVRGQHVKSQRPVIVLYCGLMSEKFRKDIASLSRKRHVSMVLADDALVTYLAMTRRSRLETFFALSIPLTWSNPYVLVGGGELPPEVYFGREHELEKVLALGGSTFIYGGRQLGKTALLHKARQKFHNPDEGQYATYIDLKAVGVGYSESLDSRSIWSYIQGRLRELGDVIPKSMADPGYEPTEEKIIGLLQAIQKHFTGTSGRRLLVLLDESDRFLESDSRRGYRETGRIKALMEDTGRRVKFVFAGLHDVLRSAEQANHPFAHFGEPIRIRPMSGSEDWKDARRLVTEPLVAAGFKFAGVALVDRILAQTNFYPNLIQLYCSHLLERMTGALTRPALPLQTIEESHLDQTYIEQSLREEIRRKFAATLQLDPRYSLIAHVIAHRSYEAKLSAAPFLSTHELSEEARGYWPTALESTSEFGFSVLLEEMVSLGVLSRDESLGTTEKRYSLRNRNMQLLMGSRDEVLSFLIETNRPRPVEFMAKDMYPEYSGSDVLGGRAPISIEQLGHLLKAESGPAVVLGNKASGIKSLPQFLKDYVSGKGAVAKRKFASIGGPKVTDARIFEATLKESIKKSNLTASSDSLIVCVSADTPWQPDWLKKAVDGTKDLPKKCRVVFFGGPDTFDCQTLATLAEGTTIPLLTLGPLSENGFQYLCQDANVPHSPEAVALAEATTGLWPSRVLKEGEPIADSDLYGCSSDLKALVNLVHKLSQGGPVRLAEVEEYATLGEPEFAASPSDIARAAVRLGLLLDDGEQRYRVPNAFARLLEAAGFRHD